jgi:hypothetical protein
VKELIVMAKGAPREIDFASSGNGSTQHLARAAAHATGRVPDDEHSLRLSTSPKELLAFAPDEAGAQVVKESGAQVN